MRFLYRDVATAEEVDPSTYSVMELLREHRLRYVLNTSQGAIILRPLPFRMKKVIDEARMNIYPSTKDLLREAEFLRPYFEGIPEEDRQPDKVQRMNEIYHILRVTDMYALGVIVSPQCGTMDDVQEIYDRLTEDEGERLSLCIQALSSITPTKDIDTTALEIAKANGLNLVDKELLDNLTVSQAAFFINRIEQENERIRQLTRQYERVVQ